MAVYDSVSGSTRRSLEKFFSDMAQGHLRHDIELMSRLYHQSVVAIEANTTFTGKEKVLEGIKFLFSVLEFTKWDGRIIAAGESESIVWVFSEYDTAWKDRKSGQPMELKKTRCTYVLLKERAGLSILQNHISISTTF